MEGQCNSKREYTWRTNRLKQRTFSQYSWIPPKYPRLKNRHLSLLRTKRKVGLRTQISSIVLVRSIFHFQRYYWMKSFNDNVLCSCSSTLPHLGYSSISWRSPLRRSRENTWEQYGTNTSQKPYGSVSCSDILQECTYSMMNTRWQSPILESVLVLPDRRLFFADVDAI